MDKSKQISGRLYRNCAGVCKQKLLQRIDTREIISNLSHIRFDYSIFKY